MVSIFKKSTGVKMHVNTFLVLIIMPLSEQILLSNVTSCNNYIDRHISTNMMVEAP